MNLVIIDGNSIANRAFYGIRQLNAPDGTPTNAVYGFITIMNRIVDEYRPDALCVAFDLKSPTFRHKKFDYYKAQRKPMPEELSVQMPIIKQILSEMGINCLHAEGFEADDIIGTVSRVCDASGWNCTVVTGDRDSLQLVTGTTSVCFVKSQAGRTIYTHYTPEKFMEEYGFEPDRLIDLKSLMGDSSDNIPGVKGIGEKTAGDLLHSFGSLEGIYDNIGSASIKDSVRKKLTEDRQSAEDSYWLATIKCDIPIDFNPADSTGYYHFTPELRRSFARLGFNRFIETMLGKAEENETVPGEQGDAAIGTVSVTPENLNGVVEKLSGTETLSLVLQTDFSGFEICDGEKIYTFERIALGDLYMSALNGLLSSSAGFAVSDAKGKIKQFMKEGLPYEGIIFDVSLAAYLINSTSGRYEVRDLSQAYLNASLPDCAAIYRLYPVLNDRLASDGMTDLYYDIEHPLCAVLASMELEGTRVDRHALAAFGDELSTDIDALTAQIYFFAGHEFNINSPKQLGEVLFEELMLPAGKKTKSGWSTNADVLEGIRDKHPIVDSVLEYRTLTKLKSTYTDGLLKVIESDDRVRTVFQMTVTATGRLSSTEPNLQNIPIRKELGSKIRRMFVPGPGNVLVDADYSQIELRILAHIADDRAMADAFESGEDFHRVTAAYVFNVPVEDVTQSMRSSAKAVNFGIVYGMSAFTLARDIGISPAQARRYIDNYLGRYSSLAAYLDNVVKEAKENGYVKTVYGRRRYLPELQSSNHNLRAFGERVALNMPIQGTAADIMKIAMINVHKALQNEGLKAKLILQVHDELIVECPEEEAEKVSGILSREMSGAAALSVPLNTEVKSGMNWAEAH